MQQIANLTLKLILALITFLVVALAPQAGVAQTEKRMALVIGNGAYQTGPLVTPANDAGLVAQTLQAAGFDVVGARDLDEDSLRHAFRDFVDSVSKAGPDAVVAIYFSGYGLQLEGENYLLPVDANIGRDTDVPLHGLRLSDYTRALAGLGLKATMVILDAARANPFTVAGQPLASGLAMVDPEPGQLIAFNAMPGTVAPEVQDGYGPFAKALSEMIREGGLQPTDVLDRVRLRVNQMTQGAQVPWEASKINTQFVFFDRGPDAPPIAPAAQTAALRDEPIRNLAAEDAYQAALARDSLDAYQDFLAAYPRDPMAKRVRAIVAARREAITWRHTYEIDTPPAYWSYLRRYSRGPHVADARRRLAQLAAAFDPPPRFAVIDYDVPPPPPDEVVYYERPVLEFDDPVFAFAPPPPPPVYILEPPPPEFVVLAPPPPPIGVFILPVPVFIPVPVYVSAPAYVAPPPNPVYFNNIHNTVVINNTTNVVTITNPAGKVVSTTPLAAPATGGPPGKGPVALTPALPAAVATKAALINSQNPPGTSATSPAKTGPVTLPPGGLAPTATAPGNKPLPLPSTPAGTSPPGGKAITTTTPPTVAPTTPAAKVTPLDATKQPGANPPAGTTVNTGKTTTPTTTPAAKLTPLDTGKQPGANPPAGTTVNTGKTTTPTTTPAAKLTPPDTGKQPGANPTVNTGKTTPATTPAAKLTPLDTGKPPSANSPAGNAGKTTAPTTPAAKLAPVDAAKKKETVAPIRPTTPTPPAVHEAARPPQPPVVHQAAPPPPPVVHQAAPPPPPVVRQAAPPPPQPVVRQVQTPVAPVVRPPPQQAPAAARGGGGGGNGKCPVVNGKPTCPH